MYHLQLGKQNTETKIFKTDTNLRNVTYLQISRFSNQSEIFHKQTKSNKDSNFNNGN